MANQDPLGRTLHFHNASAFGVAGQIDRPEKQTIPTQAAIALAPTGGRGSHRVENYKAPGVLSFSTAYVEVGGSFDETHDTYATYASSVIEDLNIFDVVKADRVVSRLTIYAQAKPNDKASPETEFHSVPSFSISDSHFENLRIAGHQINIKLATNSFSGYDTYKNFADLIEKRDKNATKWLIGNDIQPKELDEKDHNHRVMAEIQTRVAEWNKKKEYPDKAFWCSAIDHTELRQLLSNSDLKNFGGVLCVPRFGVIYLAELRIHRSHRHFNMIRVHMCSTSDGSITGGGTTGGGGSMPPP